MKPVASGSSDEDVGGSYQRESVRSVAPMVPPTKIWQPGTAFILPSASLHFLAGPPISPMSAACACRRKCFGQAVRVKARGDGRGASGGERGAGQRWAGRVSARGEVRGAGGGLHLAARVGAARPVDAQRLGDGDALLELARDTLGGGLGLDQRQAAELCAGAADEVADDVARRALDLEVHSH